MGEGNGWEEFKVKVKRNLLMNQANKTKEAVKIDEYIKSEREKVREKKYTSATSSQLII